MAVSVAGITVVQEHRAGVVQHNVENHIQAGAVRRVDQLAELVVCVGGILCESWLGAQEIVNAVAVIAARFAGEVTERRADPNPTGPEFLEVRLMLDKLLLLHAKLRGRTAGGRESVGNVTLP